jgi:hypothetical protein
VDIRLIKYLQSNAGFPTAIETKNNYSEPDFIHETANISDQWQSVIQNVFLF